MRRLVPLALALLALPAIAGDLTVNLGMDVDTSYVFRGVKRGPLGVIGRLDLTYPLTKGLELGGSVGQYVQVDRRWGLGEANANVGFRYRPPVVGKMAWIEGGFNWFSPVRDLDVIAWRGDDTLGKSTQEMYLRTRFALPGAPTIDLLKDINRRSSLTMELTASKAVKVKPFTLDVRGAIDLQFGRGLSGWRAAQVNSGLYYQLNPLLAVGPTLDLHFPNVEADPGANSCRSVLGFRLLWLPQCQVNKGTPTRSRSTTMGPTRP
jgi:hypothetical protein